MYDSKTIYIMMQKFYNIGITEKRIIDYLMSNDGVAKITYSELTEELGLDKKKFCSNVRKAVIHLEKLNLIYIKYKYPMDREGANPMKVICLKTNWMEELLKAEI